MAICKVLCVLLIFSASALARSMREDETELASELRERHIRGLCNRLNETCRVVPCCGKLQCYWKDGYSLLKDGYCVECIQRGLICQRDASCCSKMVCHKEKFGYIDGRCDDPRPAGGACYEDGQCASSECQKGKCV